MTPGQFRSHARYLRGAATEYRRMALATDVHFWKDKWIRDADKAEEDAFEIEFFVKGEARHDHRN